MHVGLFDYEEEAALAYNNAVRENASTSLTNPVGSDGRLVPKLETSLQYYGVRWCKRAKKWYARVTRQTLLGLDGMEKSLGYFTSER